MNREEERLKLIQEIQEQRDIIESCQKLMIRHNLSQIMSSEEDDNKMTLAFNKMAEARKTIKELNDRLSQLD